MDKNKLLEAHQNMSFPQFPEFEALVAWIENLAEVQGHIVGLVRTDNVTTQDLSEFLQFKDRLNDLIVSSEKDKACLEYCKLYGQVLEDLLTSAVKNPK